MVAAVSFQVQQKVKEKVWGKNKKHSVHLMLSLHGRLCGS